MALSAKQVIAQLLALFNDPDVTSDTALYDPPFGFDANSLEIFLGSEVQSAFGVVLHVDDLDDPPTFGGLVTAIMKASNAKPGSPLASFATALVQKTRPKNYGKGH